MFRSLFFLRSSKKTKTMMVITNFFFLLFFFSFNAFDTIELEDDRRRPRRRRLHRCSFPRRPRLRYFRPSPVELDVCPRNSLSCDRSSARPRPDSSQREGPERSSLAADFPISTNRQFNRLRKRKSRFTWRSDGSLKKFIGGNSTSN